MPGMARTLLAGLGLAAVLVANGADAATVTKLRLGVHKDKTRLVLDMDGPGIFTVEPSADGRELEVVLDGTDWRAASNGKGKGLVNGFAFLGGGGESRLLLAMQTPSRVKKAFALKKPNRIVVDLEPAPELASVSIAPTAPTPPTAPAPVAQPATPVVSEQVAAVIPEQKPMLPVSQRVDPHLTALDALMTPEEPAQSTVGWRDPDASNPCTMVKNRTAMAEIADAETLFLWAECARAEGDLPRAADYYREVLAADPGAQRARLELADVLYQMREHDASNEQFAQVLQSKPPKRVADNVQAKMTEVEMHKRGIDPPQDFAARITTGIVYDTNVNGGPTENTVDLFGSPFTLSDESLSQKTFGLLYSIDGQGVLDETAEHKVVVNAGYSGAEYLKHSQYEVDSVYLRGSYQQKFGDTIGSLPLLASRAWVGGNAYSTSFALTPEVRHPVSDTVAVIGSIPLSSNSYDASTTKDGVGFGAVVGAQLAIENDWSFRPSLSRTHYRAKASTESYVAQGVSAQLAGKLDGRWLLTGSAGYKWTNYNSIDFAYGERREDGTMTLGAGLTWDMRDYVEGVELNMNYGYTSADSTITTYDYDRHQSIISVTKKF